MKKLFLILLAVPFLSACDMLKVDNYEGPNAVLRGKILDDVTGQLVETDIQTGSRLIFQELGRPTGTLTRVIKQNGTYCDSLAFAGTYSIDFSSCNFYPFKVDTFVIHKGDNIYDFKVTPYIRVKNVQIRQDGNRIVATFNIQGSRSEVRVNNIRLYAHTDIYVGDQVTTYTPGTTGAGNPNPTPSNWVYQRSFSVGSDVIDESVTHELSIDLNNLTNKAYFKYPTKNYYFRVGALARIASGGTSVGTIRRNYAPYTILNVSVPQ